LRHWRQTFGGLTIKLVSSCSLLLILIVAASAAVDYGDLDARLSVAKDKTSILAILNAVPKDADPMVLGEIDELNDVYSESQANTVKWDIAQRAMKQSAETPTDATKTAKQIKSSPIYQDPGEKDSANWLGTALNRLQNLFRPSDKAQAPRLPKMEVGGFGGGAGFFTGFMWFLLAAALAVFAYFAFRHVSLKGTLKRKRKAVLEDDEPERSLDEWLAQADDLAAKGQYREAVRALYLACLLKFDEHRVARFVRGETNWEHLTRIQASPLMPATIEFRSPTQAFDQIWYGHRVNGITDVQRFRDWYSELKRTLEIGK